MKKTIEELIGEAITFAVKPESWRTDNEIPPDAATIAHAIQWIRRACESGLDVEIFPGADNSIFVVPMSGDLACEIEVAGNALASLELQKGIGPEYEILKLIDSPTAEEATEMLANLVSSQRLVCSHYEKSYWQRLFPAEQNLYGAPICIYEFSPPDIMTREESVTTKHVSQTCAEASRFSPPVVSTWLETHTAVTSIPTTKAYSRPENLLVS